MILRSLWLRPMLAHPLRFVATVLGVAIGVASVVSTILASQAAVSFLGRDVEEISGAARLEITRPGGVDVELLGDLRPLATDVVLSPIVEGSALAPALQDLVRILGADLLQSGDLRAAELSTGDRTMDEAFEAMLQGDGAALSARLADDLGVVPGERVELLVRSRPVSVEVAAVFAPSRLASAWDRIVLVDLATAQELFDRYDAIDRIELLTRSDIADDALAVKVAELLPEGYRAAPVSTRRKEGERMVRALEFNLTALSGVSVLVGMVLVATTLATSVVQRRKSIALLRSLGASRGQLAGAVLAEAATIGALGGLLGVVGGWIGAGVALDGVRMSVATIAQGAVTGSVPFQPIYMVAGLLIGLLSSLGAALRPLEEALRTPPVQGLATEHPESVVDRPWRARAAGLLFVLSAAAFFASLPPIDDRPVWALVSALLLLGSLLIVAAPLVDLCSALRVGAWSLGLSTSLRVAQAALEAGRKRASWAAGAVGVAVGLAVAMATMVGSFRQTVVDWTDQAMRSDLFVRPMRSESGIIAGGIDPEVVRIARELFGRDAVEPYRQESAFVDGQRVAFGGAAFDIVGREGGVPFVDGRPSTEVFTEAWNTRGIVVNEPFERRFGLGRGDTVQLQTATGPITKEITGVYHDYSAHTGRVVIALPEFEAIHGPGGPESMAIFLPGDAGDAEVDAARRELTSALAGRYLVDVLPNRTLHAEILDVFERTFAVTIGLQAIASVVAAIAVVTVLGALVRERKRELALLRVLGASTGQVTAVVVSEALLLGLAGALGGLVVGLVVGWVLVAVVNVQSFGWTLRFLPPWGSIFWTVGAVVPACLFAGLVPAVVARRSTPQEALRAA